MSDELEEFVINFGKYVVENFHKDKTSIINAINEYCIDNNIDFEVDMEILEEDDDDFLDDLDDLEEDD